MHSSVCLFLYSFSLTLIFSESACDSNYSVKTNISVTESNGYRENEEHLRWKRATPPFTKFLDELFDQRLFNTTMNFIVPGAKVQLPRHTAEGTVDHLAMQAFFGLFWAAAWLATIAVPVTTTYFKPLGIGRSFHTNKNNTFNFEWKLTKNITEAIGLDWETCMQKTICQAHEFPEKYGFIGKTLQLLFSPNDASEENFVSVDISPYHDAASKGAFGLDCEYIYNCFFDVLDVLSYIRHHFHVSWQEPEWI